MLLLLPEHPKINLVFSSWFSLFFILFLLLGMIAWITYVAFSIRHIKKKLPHMMTKTEFAAEFEKFKREIADGR